MNLSTQFNSLIINTYGANVRLTKNAEKLRGYQMSCKFRISAQRNNENLHLRLEGDFDGSSAHQLINYIKRNIHKRSRVVINTSSLKHIYPFGTNVLLNNFDFTDNRPVDFVFTGDKASDLASERNRFHPNSV